MITVTKSLHETKRVVTYIEATHITLLTSLVEMIAHCRSLKITCIRLIRHSDASINLVLAKTLVEYIQDGTKPSQYHPDLRITISPYVEDHAMTYTIHQERTETICPDTDHPDDCEWRSHPCEA